MFFFLYNRPMQNFDAVMEKLNEMFDVRFLIPDLATYGTVIGTALRG